MKRIACSTLMAACTAALLLIFGCEPSDRPGGPSPATAEVSRATNGEARATLAYWLGIDLAFKRAKADGGQASDGQVGDWNGIAIQMEQAADDIAQLPVDGVDMELLDVAMRLVKELHGLAAMTTSANARELNFIPRVDIAPSEFEELRERLSKRYSVTFPPLMHRPLRK